MNQISTKIPPDAIKAFQVAATIIRDRAEDIADLAEPLSIADALADLAHSFDCMAAGDADGFIEHFSCKSCD